jgi:hypothetical protein
MSLLTLLSVSKKLYNMGPRLFSLNYDKKVHVVSLPSPGIQSCRYLKFWNSQVLVLFQVGAAEVVSKPMTSLVTKSEGKATTTATTTTTTTTATAAAATTTATTIRNYFDEIN